MTVVVTGGLGFLGINVVRALASAGSDVLVVDRREPDEAARAFLTPFGSRVRYITADVTAADWAGPPEATEAVIHAAAVTLIGADEEADAVAAAASVNVTGTANVVSWAISAGVPRIVHVSSASVYGSAADLPWIDEDTPANPETIYAITKLAGERVALRLAELAGVELVVARLSHLYGPMECPGASRQRLSVVHDWVDALIAGRSLRTAAPSLARDFLYVVDAAEALVAMARAPLDRLRVFNVAQGQVLTEEQALARLAELEPSARIESEPGVPVTSRPPLRTERIRKWTGWRPRFDFTAGCREYLAWRRTGVMP